MNQYDLFGGTPPHVKGSMTSLGAAESVAESAVSLRGKILALIRSSHGLTCDDVEVSTGMRHQTASARIRELVLKGSIKDSGSVRKTRSGRNAVVYRVID